MNKGSFDRNCELLLIHITNMERYGKLEICNARTKFFAKILNKSTRQIYRYLKALEDRHLIKRYTTPLKRNKKKIPFKNRIIHSYANKNKSTKEIMDIHFDPVMHKKTKNVIIKNLIKSEDFVLTNIIKGNENYTIKNKITNLADSLINQTVYLMSQEQPKTYEQKLAELRRICDEDEKELAEKRFNRKREAKAEDILLERSAASRIRDGETNLAVLAAQEIKRYRDMENLMQELEPPSHEEKVEKIQFMVNNSSFKNNKFYIIFNIAGEIPYEVELFDYVTWDKDSEEFKIFKRLFEEIHT